MEIVHQPRFWLELRNVLVKERERESRMIEAGLNTKVRYLYMVW